MSEAFCQCVSADGGVSLIQPCSIPAPPGFVCTQIPDPPPPPPPPPDPPPPPPPPPPDPEEPPPPPPDPPIRPDVSFTPGYPYCWDYIINDLGTHAYYDHAAPQYPGGFNPSLPGCENGPAPSRTLTPYITTDAFSLGNINRASLQTHISILRGLPLFKDQLKINENARVSQSFCKNTNSADFIRRETNLPAWNEQTTWSTGRVDLTKEEEPHIIVRQLRHPYGVQNPETDLPLYYVIGTSWNVQYPSFHLSVPELTVAPFDYFHLFPRHWFTDEGTESLSNHPDFPEPFYLTDAFSLGQIERSGLLVVEPVNDAYVEYILNRMTPETHGYYVRHDSTALYIMGLGAHAVLPVGPGRVFKLNKPGRNPPILVMHVFERFPPWHYIPYQDFVPISDPDSPEYVPDKDPVEVGWFLVHFYGEADPVL